MPYPSQPWRDALQPASFGGAGFHVEVGGRSGGRRIAGHEYPKSETPFAEDMGRKATGWQVTAYLIGPDYLAARDALVAMLDTEGPHTFVHPSFGSFQVHCGPYTASESRERGGFVQVEIALFEAGQNPDASATADTQAQASAAADANNGTAAATGNAALSGQGGIGSDAVAGGTASAPSITSIGPGGIGSDAVAGGTAGAYPVTTPTGSGGIGSA